MSAGQTGEAEFKEKLIASVKKEVKQLMEEAVTKKFVHEESGAVTSLCAAVEACLSQGLRRRALGLFKTSSTTALLHKVAKHCPEAAIISKKVQDIENSDPNKRSSSSSDSVNKPQPILKKGSSSSSVLSTTSPPSSPPIVKYLWIRLALYEKRLSKIIEHLVTNAARYYERDSLVADPDYGSILSSLLVGPCALEYSRTKTPDHFWSDPHADELVQRHRISSGNPTPPSCRRPIINFKRSLHTSSEEASSGSFKSSSSVTVAKDYVESLHQNSRATLLYGKNNVLVLPKDVSEPMPGYLSLHQTAQSLTVKWTPNQLMNGHSETESTDKSFYWAYALNINVDEIVYVHCHQIRGEDTGGTIILVGQDGVQQPPIHFPEGGHMAAFLSCLETGLLPHGQLDPPLWSNRGFGKIFSWPQKGRRRILPSVLENNEEHPIDYVFRVVNKSNHEEFLATHPILELGRTSPRRVQLGSCSTNGSSDCSSKSMSLDQSESPQTTLPNQSASIALVCTTMRRQIISRAFYGWLAYCRHLSTVRTHLSGLVNGRITPEVGAEEGLTKEKWESLQTDGIVSDGDEVYRLVYYGGVHQDIRKKVWPYLLGHYEFGSTEEDRLSLDESTKRYYETTMSEWLAVEAIVRQRDKEKTAHAVAKLSSESSSGGHKKIIIDPDDEMENDVFEDNDFSDISDPGDYEDDRRNDFDDEDDIPVDGEKINEEEQNKTNEKPSRLNKSSTDSGNVPDAYIKDSDIIDDEEDNVKDKREIKYVTDTSISDNKSQENFEAINNDLIKPTLQLNIEENCFIDNDNTNTIVNASNNDDSLDTKIFEGNESNISNKSSPSTSYETVGNEFLDLTNNDVSDVDDNIRIPEFQSIDGGDVQLEITDAMNVNESDEIIGVEGGSCENDSFENDVTMKFDISTKEPQKESTDDDSDEKTQISLNHNKDEKIPRPPTAAVIVTNASIDISSMDKIDVSDGEKTTTMSPVQEESNGQILDALQEPKSACVSPASSNGGIYSCELLESFGLNLHRIEKDVQRCDRNYWYFANENLDKLRNVICTYVWEHLDIGYMQGMCDLVAPLLVIFDDESLSYGCFCKLMERMIENFPNGGAMDMHFANMRSLIQILDSEMYDLMHAHGDYTHFYFCYRWFLLDFKRELIYADVFATWECIWAAKHVASGHFVLFLALALLETYRDIILSNSMDFTDVIKFFNEMAERHNTPAVLKLARNLVHQLQTIIENK
ncbi:small G protein signaling modulator 1-like isoform X2 [Condylostylus longicornis]|uniref:small G protein signaling modulator 1-like isoform X2 n=1 Tax=Condylostylus longicornis TaxID=2530218 RepID=UPI00244DCB9B|nr:small G protein signaling modulator 1-like isoform X2 [Condylostylus longicornis]